MLVYPDLPVTTVSITDGGTIKVGGTTYTSTDESKFSAPTLTVETTDRTVFTITSDKAFASNLNSTTNVPIVYWNSINAPKDGTIAVVENSDKKITVTLDGAIDEADVRGGKAIEIIILSTMFAEPLLYDWGVVYQQPNPSNP